MEVIIKIGIHFIHLKEKHNLRFIKIVPDRIIPVGCQNNCLGVNPFNNVPFCLCFLSQLAYSWYNLWRRARKKKNCCNYFCCHLLETIWQIRLQKRCEIYYGIEFSSITVLYLTWKVFVKPPPTPRHSKPTFKAFQKEGKQPTNQASKVQTGHAWSTGYTMTEFFAPPLATADTWIFLFPLLPSHTISWHTWGHNAICETFKTRLHKERSMGAVNLIQSKSFHFTREMGKTEQLWLKGEKIALCCG